MLKAFEDMENVSLSASELATLKKKAKKKPHLNHMIEIYEETKKEWAIQEEKAVMERVKSFEDACMELGMIPKKIKSIRGKRGIAFEKLAIIVKALNGNKHYKFLDDNVEHWHPEFYRRKNGTTLIFKGSVCDYETVTLGNSALYTLKSKALSDYCAKQFFYLWKQAIL